MKKQKKKKKPKPKRFDVSEANIELIEHNTIDFLKRNPYIAPETAKNY